MKRSPLAPLALVPALLLLAACSGDRTIAPANEFVPASALSSQSASPSTFIIDLTDAAVSPALANEIAAAGGTLTASMDGIGVAVAESDNPDFAGRVGRMAGVRTVTPDRMVQWVKPDPRAADFGDLTVESTDVGEQAAVTGSAETFRSVQWNVDAISAPAAWDAGYRGAGARVAIIDGGVHSTHLDIRDNLDVARSRSFVPGIAYNSDLGTFWHGTHVAGIVAAPANTIGTVGVAPSATIIGVKALHGGSGSFSAIINAVYYSATPIAEGGAGAHIINMSLGASFATNDAGAVSLKNALSKATTYAYQRGVTVIASAGNSKFDLDHTNNLLVVPAQSAHVITVSSTGPFNFGGGATNFDRPASYTNYGQSAITLAGPGGDSALPGSAVCVFPRKPSGSIFQFCWVLDMVMAPCRGAGASIGSYCWAAGTSMSAPAVAGVAALIVGKNGPMSPAHLLAALRASSDDLGKPGNDDFYGRGRVNALRAVQ